MHSYQKLNNIKHNHKFHLQKTISPQLPSDLRIGVFNLDTKESLSNYILVETVPDKYAEQVNGIRGQFVSTLALQDRYGREDSNNNLNVFLQVSHTNNEVTSLRGVQLGGDDIQVFVNGVDQGGIVKTAEIS